jgi:two-component system, NarL family, sensor histidine kinase LiaS
MRRTWLARLRTTFRRLRWKMTLSYTIVTVGALVVLEFVLIFGGLLIVRRFFHSPLLARAIEQSYAQPLVAAARPYVKQTPVNVAELQAALNAYAVNALDNSDSRVTLGVSSSERESAFVVGSEGKVLAVIGAQFKGELSRPYQGLGPVSPLVAATLDGDPLGQRYAYLDGQLLLVTPILRESGMGTPMGAVGLSVPVPAIDRGLINDLLPVVGASLVVFTLGTGIIGTVFGFLTSRSLVRRLDHISTVADDWSKGDFSVFIQDRRGDELAALGERMNRMAEQLQNLVEQRNRLAVLQERNRIARDLHDSVKQQAFAAAGQIGAAKAHLARDAQAAETHLGEAEELIYSMRQELSLLIEELRPAALEEKGLGTALRDYGQRWSRRSGIMAEVEIIETCALPIETEQTFFRIAQEALANVARHSQATKAHISLACDQRRLVLKVADDGIGFDPQRRLAGFGLSSIRQRAATLSQGSVTVRSAPGEGTTIEVAARMDGQETRDDV